MEQPTLTPRPSLQRVVLADEKGEEYVEYRIDGEIATEAAYEAQRVQNAEVAQQNMMDVSRFMDEQNAAETAGFAEKAAADAERRSKATAELEALGLSAETIDTIVRGI